MKLHCLQHTASEGPAGVERWARSKGHEFSTTRFDLNQSLPDLNEFEALVVMGGPMNIYQYREYPWLRTERIFIQQALEKNKKIVGFCLGSQLLADALGARVYQNVEYEIGWYPVEKTTAMDEHHLFQDFPASLEVMHWHGDTFDLPAGCHHLAQSLACQNQAFLYKDQAVGFQFHLEVAPEDLKEFIGSGEDLKLPGNYVQNEREIWDGAEKHAPLAQTVLTSFLDKFFVGV